MLTPFSHVRGALKCPKCKTLITFGDVFVNSPANGAKMTIGNATSVILDPCGCSATSGDSLFLDMLQIVEIIADPEISEKPTRLVV